MDLASNGDINKKLPPDVEFHREGEFNTPTAKEIPRICFIKETLTIPEVSRFLTEWSRNRPGVLS